LAILLEGELAALIIVLLGTTSAVLSTLSKIVSDGSFVTLAEEHGGGGAGGWRVKMRSVKEKERQSSTGRI
jgi:hypothetical protein